jgi:hypothetical protein
MSPNSFPKLPVLEDLVKLVVRSKGRVLAGSCLVCVQHLLDSTGSLLEACEQLGLLSSDCFVLGKSYSASQEVFDRFLDKGIRVRVNRSDGKRAGFEQEFTSYVDRLWTDVRRQLRTKRYEQIIIVDDGGHCIGRLPAVIPRSTLTRAVEQTTSGVRRLANYCPVPVVNVATSAAKAFIESPLVVDAVLRRLTAYFPAAPSSIGIVGLGRIGSSLASVLRAEGYRIFAYDSRNHSSAEVVTCHSVVELLRRVDYIFGCTGEDAIGADWVTDVSGEKTFISCSSEDREFRSLLNYAQQEHLDVIRDAKDDLMIELPKARLHVVRGGYPANFDRQNESVPSREIQVTRGLLLAGIVQASLLGSNTSPQLIELDHSAQMSIVDNWLRHVPERRSSYSGEILSHFQDLAWIRSQSEGSSIPLSSEVFRHAESA